MPEASDIQAPLLRNPVVSPLIDNDEPATTKAEVPANPASAAEAKKTDRPAATDENAKSSGTAEDSPQAHEQDPQKQSRRQRKLQIERDARIRAETRAEIAERALADARGNAKEPAEKAAQPPKREDFQSDDAFLDAYIDYRADQRAEAKLKSDREERSRRDAQSKTQAEQKAFADDWMKREAEFRAKVPTYEEDIEEFLDVYLDKIANSTRLAILEFGPETLHYLGTHPEVVAEILKLSPARQVAALGKLDLKAAVEPEVDTNTEAPAPRERAVEPPPPAKHVRQGTSKPAGYSDDMDAYVEQRRKERARWAR